MSASAEEASRPPLPPFETEDAALRKVKLAEQGWNTRNPAKVALAYTPGEDCPCTCCCLSPKRSLPAMWLFSHGLVLYPLSMEHAACSHPELCNSKVLHLDSWSALHQQKSGARQLHVSSLTLTEHLCLQLCLLNV